MPSNTLLYTTAAISFLSFLSGVAVLLAHWRLPALRKPPGTLVLFQALAQAVTDLHWVLTNCSYLATGCVLRRMAESGLWCRLHGLVSSYSFFMSLNYIMCLTLELIYKLRSPMNNAQGKRAVMMHLFSHGTCVVLVLFLGVFEASGKSALGSCFILNDSWGDYVLYLPICLYCPFAVATVIYALASYQRTERLKRRRFLVRYSLVILMYEICWTPICFLHVAENAGGSSIFEAVSWVLSSIGGLIVNSIRLSDPALRSAFRHHRRLSLGLSLQGISTGKSSISDPEIFKFYQDVLLEGVLSTYLGLSLAFSMLADRASQSTPTSAKGRLALPVTSSLIASCDFLDDYTKHTCTPHSVRHYEGRIIVHSPALFERLREAEGVSCFELFESFNPVSNQSSIHKNTGNKGGRSDAFLSFSMDKKFVIKTVTHSEKSFLVNEFLPAYSEHVLRNQSLLARVLGLFSFEVDTGGGCTVIVMVNVVGCPQEVQTLFDLKGSKVSRRTLRDESINAVAELPKGRTYKDMDFLQTVGSLDLEQEDREALVYALRGDLALLTDLNVMDYSVLLAFVPSVTEPLQSRSVKYRFSGRGRHAQYSFYIGLIDFLQQYTTMKQLETISKRMVSRQYSGVDISVVNPADYSARLMAFLLKVVQAPSLFLLP